MPIPFLNSITLNKNEIQEFKVYNLTPDPTLTSAGDYGYMWLNTSDSPKTLKWWDGTSIRSIVDSGNTSTLTVGTANDLSGGVAGSLPYQQGVGDTTFLGIGTANQVLTVNSGATAPQWLSQSSLSVGSAATATTATTATNVAGGANGSILVQSGAGTTGQLAIGANGYILTSNGTTPGWSASIPSTSVSGLAASATTDTTNASNISSGTLGLARLSLASGQFYVGDGSNNPAATAKSSIPLSGFGAAGADVAMGGFKITGLADPAAATDAATMGYVDSVAQGLDVKASCLVATTADITLASPGAVTIDGIYSATDFTAGTTRILVKDQSAPAENGIYIWQGPSSAMTRSSDANTWDELVGAFTFIETGTANADSGWVCTANAGGTLGTTPVPFVKFSQAGSYTAGNGMVLSGGVFHFAQSSAYTAGQIPFCSNSPTANSIGFSSNLFWDSSNNRLGIGTSSPTAGMKLDIVSTTSNHIVRFTDSVNATGYLGVTSTGVPYLHGNNNKVSLSCSTSNTTPTEQLRITNPGIFEFLDGAGGTRMTLDASGNLGLGAVSPSQRFFVQSAASPIAAFNSTSVSGPYVIFQSSGTSFGDIGSAKAITGSYNATDMALNVRSTGSMYFCVNDAAKMTLDASGNLGVGISSSIVAKLQVVGTAFINGATSGVRIGDNGSNCAFISAYDPTLSNPRDIALQTGGGQILLANAGTASNPSIARFGNANTGLYFPTTNTLALAVGGSDAVYIDSSRNVGIGTSSGLLAKLDIVGASQTGSSTNFSTKVIKASFATFGGPSPIASVLAFYDFGVYVADIGISYSGGSDNLIFSVNSSASSGAPTERLRIKGTGQLNFVGLASDPAGAAGDVYYNSGSNVFKVYDTGWKTLPRKYVVQLSDGSVTVVGNAYTLTHNFASKDVTISIRRTTDDAVVLADVTMPTTNTATVTFAAAITAANYYVTVIG